MPSTQSSVATHGAGADAPAASASISFVDPTLAALITAGMTLLALFAFVPSFVAAAAVPAPLRPFHWAAFAVFRSQSTLQIVLIAAIVIHVGEAAVAVRWCLQSSSQPHRSRMRSAPVLAFWAAQTFLFGGASLSKLAKVVAPRDAATQKSN
jgi:hypothetical protein